MKILTIGMSPYLTTSRARLNRIVLKYLYAKGHNVISAVWGHDKSYYFPDESSGNPKFFYNFKFGEDKHKILLIPYNGSNEAVSLYETVKQFQPDVVITIGDYAEMQSMKALRMYSPHHFSWLAISTCHTAPNDFSILSLADFVLFTNENTRKTLLDIDSDSCYVGSCIWPKKDEKTVDSTNIMAIGKKMTFDNLPMVIEAVSSLDGFSLYAHTNVHDPGHYDMITIQEMFDSDRNFLRYPDRFVSMVEGVSDADLSTEYLKADILVSVPVTSATSITVFEGMAHGCYPVLSDCGSNREIATLLSRHLKMDPENFLVKTTKVMVPGEVFIHIPDSEDLCRKILLASKNLQKDKGLSTQIMEFTKEYSTSVFLNKVVEIVERIKASRPTMCLESI